MRVHVVSDVHGNAEALSRASEGADALIVLGDLLDFIDYHDHRGGIFGRLFGEDNVSAYATLRRTGTRAEMRAFVQSLWDSLDDPAAAVDEAMREQYARLFSTMAALDVPVYAIPGNVDAPALWPEFASDGVRLVDGDVVEIGGLRFGFVGGAVLPEGATPRANAVWRPHLLTREEFDERVAGLSDIDVLCSHIPPAIPELTYDVVSRTVEIGARSLLERIRAERPRWSLFGHVHQPLTARFRVEYTECRNVGHFQRTAVPYVLRW
ncbi:metallophosphoesterase family protein [Saccharomonospora viridis]|uniref:Predicted phosphoesterase, ICC n=2 Tax=Saccharomonospora viridis TaxID=1852 RepID=C7MZB7_SACVD|nr:metallophosphoesterase [Saccharomonospora viridis]ACU97484.1 predicted phosphoesterase, ICC [Saccharomonospora viridis DSM 43017]KHF43685.1 metallophosphoesterase [Saccharomonospora viridis]SFP86130.1 Predicted phosphoesterase [Saccharomonospora viridis]